MSATDYGSMQPEKKYAWGLAAYQEYREKFFFTGMLGKGMEGIIEHVTELTKNSKGEVAAFFRMIPRLRGGGIVGDNQMAGRERSSEAHWQKITFDQFRNAVINKGKLADQKSLVQIRKEHRPLLSDWLADSNEDQAVMVASGISFDYNTDGSPRETPEGQDSWSQLAYAADIKPPSTNRHFRYDASQGLVPGDTSALDPADVPIYDLIPDIAAMASQKRITPLRIDGKDYWVWLVHDNTMARLWKNEDFRKAILQAGERGKKHPLFSGAGTVVMPNGLIIIPYARVFNNKGAADGSKWGASGDVNGTRSLLLGAQALAQCDLGVPEWNEEEKDYKNRQGFGIAKMQGWLKPQFPSSYDNGSVEDFGMAAIDFAL